MMIEEVIFKNTYLTVILVQRLDILKIVVLRKYKRNERQHFVMCPADFTTKFFQISSKSYSTAQKCSPQTHDLLLAIPNLPPTLHQKIPQLHDLQDYTVVHVSSQFLLYNDRAGI